ncbi:unnamed protein product [Haemonchus placei]|uniref:Uncharacterized protein n=1 Tax=Haemonchus placei TaxID=6290 RepID=A0A0N4WGN9_HAEPC|nr:unnamed protein product [Haemonchus placei]
MTRLCCLDDLAGFVLKGSFCVCFCCRMDGEAIVPSFGRALLC